MEMRKITITMLMLRETRIVDHEAEIIEACKRDLGKCFFETQISEITWVTNDIIFVCKNLEKWAKDEKPEDIPLVNYFMSPRIRKEPLGCVLIIGPFNFPINLTFGPLIGAIAGGNTAIVKPSEQAPACAAVMQKILAASVDPSCYTIVNGGIPETQALLSEKWDKIFFTGSANVGKIVTKAAAPTLTPVTLELGGRNPAIVTKQADLHLVARRLLWGKIFNAGQVCISQNYILVDKDVVSTLIAELKIAMADFFPNGAKASPDYGRIISPQQFSRIKKMLDDTSGKIVMGGTMDAEQKFIEPTVIEVSDPTDSLITQESFGPLIPILPVENLDEAIKIANSVHATPLGLYPFGSRDEVAKVLREVRSGGASINDSYTHGIIPTLAFGGVGDSGTGSYRGRASFDCFVHRRSVTTTPGWMEKLLAVRYPPYEGKYKQFAKMSVSKPNFDREGNVKFSLFRYILTLGSGSAKRGLIRAAVLATIVVALTMAMDQRGEVRR
jgi:beta-apo-4'-carotenal oxygenase